MGDKYVVRGATVQCGCGSSPSRLNLPNSHGVYINEKPVLNDQDSAANVNVMSFGDCSITDGPCHPQPSALWDTAKGDLLVNGRPALITRSVLSCTIGGNIEIKSDGQNG
jgi:hypothetical protein